VPATIEHHRAFAYAYAAAFTTLREEQRFVTAQRAMVPLSLLRLAQSATCRNAGYTALLVTTSTFDAVQTRLRGRSASGKRNSRNGTPGTPAVAPAAGNATLCAPNAAAGCLLRKLALCGAAGFAGAHACSSSWKNARSGLRQHVCWNSAAQHL
jgi:hypothetical protein